MKVSAIIPAAGDSTRMSGISKIFAPINNLPLIGHSLRTLQDCGAIDEIIIAAKDFDHSRLSELAIELRLKKVSKIVRGGRTRAESVYNALAEASGDFVAIHDGARPCISAKLCELCISKAKESKAAIPVIPVAESVKSCYDGLIVNSVDRSGLFVAQTPQCFERNLIKSALEKALKENLSVTDDAAAVEALPHPIKIVPGEPFNIKVTVFEDLILASKILLLNG